MNLSFSPKDKHSEKPKKLLVFFSFSEYLSTQQLIAVEYS